MAQYPRAELDEMVTRWLEANLRCEETGDWEPLAEFYAVDATYGWNYGPDTDFMAVGREEIRQYALGTEMAGLAGWSYPYEELLVDEVKGQAVGFWRQLADATRPDGSHYEVRGIGGSWFRYGGNFQWSWQRDWFDLGNVGALFLEMMTAGAVTDAMAERMKRAAQGPLPGCYPTGSLPVPLWGSALQSAPTINVLVAFSDGSIESSVFLDSVVMFARARIAAPEANDLGAEVRPPARRRTDRPPGRHDVAMTTRRTMASRVGLAIAAVATLAACSGDDDAGGDPPASTAASPSSTNTTTGSSTSTTTSTTSTVPPTTSTTSTTSTSTTSTTTSTSTSTSTTSTTVPPASDPSTALVPFRQLDLDADVVAIGQSAAGAPIVAERSGTSGGRRVLVIGVIHGDEEAGMAIVDDLRQSPVPEGVELWLVPSMNPDGQAADDRHNANQVDLNRNFPYNWGPLGAPGDGQYAGTGPASEPETQAIVNFVAQLRPDIVIWYHQDLYVISPAEGREGRIRNRYAELTGLPIGAITGGTYTGVAATWARRELAVDDSVAFIVELGPTLSDLEAALHADAVRTIAVEG